MRLFIVACLLLSSQGLFSQQEEVVPDDVSFAVIEKVPVYPGCKGQTNLALKDCMSKQIATVISKNFNVKKASRGLKPGRHQIFVKFIINKNGAITDINARAPSPKLEKEAIRIIKKLPKMTPGQQKGKNVGVLYSLPITFNIEDKKG